MSIQDSISQKLTKNLSPSVIEVINESQFHNVPPGSESHFKVVLVSELFKELLPLARHRKIHDLLDVELKNGVHALILQLHTPEEWLAKGGAINSSPPCLGGSKENS